MKLKRALGRRWHGPPRTRARGATRRHCWADWVRTLWADAQDNPGDGALWGDCCVRFCMNVLRPDVLTFRDYVAGAVVATEYAHPALGIRHQAGLDDDDTDGVTPGWGTTAATVAHALRWRYPRASYVFRRLRRDIESRLRSGAPIDLLPAGYGLLVMQRDHAVMVDHDGWKWSYPMDDDDDNVRHRVRVRAAGYLQAADLVDPTDPDPAHHRWELYSVFPPSEWEVARTADETPRGIALRARWRPLRTLVQTLTGQEGCQWYDKH